MKLGYPPSGGGTTASALGVTSDRPRNRGAARNDWINVFILRSFGKRPQAVESEINARWGGAGKNVTVSIPDGGRQKFEIPDLQLPAFFDQNDLDVKIGIQATVLLQVFHTDSLSLRHVLKFLR